MKHCPHNGIFYQYDRNVKRNHNCVAMLYYRTQGTKNKLCGSPPQYAPAPCKLTIDLLTLKVLSESHVMCDVGQF